MDSKTKLSVIIPVYGAEKYLHQCLDSILAQTFNDFEILLIDDGSKDNCPQIIDEYASKDSRITAIHKENSGYGASVNVGLDKAKGKYIAIIEPDDFIDSRMFEDLFTLAEQTGADITKSAYYLNYEVGKYKNCVLFDFADKFSIPQGAFNIEDCPEFLSYHPSIWSAIYRREFLNKNNIRMIEATGAGWTDNPFQVQTMCLAEKIAYTSKAYYHWRVETLYDYDALKDYTIPFKRSREIHTWLSQNNISSPKILKNLYKREIVYLNQVLSMKGIYTAKNRIKEAENYAKNINKTTALNKEDLQIITKLIHHPYLYFLQLQLRKFTKNIFKIKWRKEHKYIIILGKFISF